jgi:hypothetical protein
VIGAIAKTVATILTYPCQVAQCKQRVRFENALWIYACIFEYVKMLFFAVSVVLYIKMLGGSHKYLAIRGLGYLHCTKLVKSRPGAQLLAFLTMTNIRHFWVASNSR